MNGAQLILDTLHQAGVRTLFGYPGGCIMPLYDALLESPIEHILCRHEQAAALAADGLARSTGRLGVCVATSGPGATNLVTGVANAYMDSVPLLVITGQVPRALIGTDAFQETDILGMTLGIVKHSWLIRSVEELAGVLPRAIHLACSGRPGPVWLDIPKDVLLEAWSGPRVRPPAQAKPGTADEALLARVAERIRAARRPVIYNGGGVLLGRAVDAFRDLLARTGIPTVETLKGLGNPSPDYPWDLGMLGMHGSAAANRLVHESDLLITIGARFDDRATGRPSDFAPGADIIQFDCDRAECAKILTPSLFVQGDLQPALSHLAALFDTPPAIDDWRRHALELKARLGFREDTDQQSARPISGPAFVRTLSQVLPEQAIVACDVGQHQMWVAQHFRVRHPAAHLSSGGLGTMGFGLPAAMGAALGNPGRPVIAVMGDGSFMMNVQELATLKRYALPVKMILMDNQRLGMVRQQQSLFFNGRLSEIDLSDNPDFLTLTRAFDIPSLSIRQRFQMRRGIETLLAYPGPMLLHVAIEADENVWPIVPPGAANHELIQPEESLT